MKIDLFSSDMLVTVLFHTFHRVKAKTI